MGVKQIRSGCEINSCAMASGRTRLALARLLTLDLMSAFGFAEVAQVTPEAELVLDRFSQGWHQRVKDWAAAASVRVLAN